MKLKLLALLILLTLIVDPSGKAAQNETFPDFIKCPLQEKFQHEKKTFQFNQYSEKKIDLAFFHDLSPLFSKSIKPELSPIYVFCSMVIYTTRPGRNRQHPGPSRDHSIPVSKFSRVVPAPCLRIFSPLDASGRTADRRP